MIILTNYRRYNLVIVFSAIMLVKSSLGLYQNDERLCRRIKCGNEVSWKICPIKCATQVQGFDSNIYTKRNPIKKGDDKMCMKHSDCPKGFPICMPGPYTKEILLNDDEDNSFFIGRCKTFRCESDQDCKDAVADTMLMNTKMKCVFKENERKKESTGLCVQNNSV